MTGGEFLDPPAWLIAKIDQKVELLKRTLKSQAFGQFQVAVTPLVEPPEGASDEAFKQWEQTCDNCGAFVPNDLWSGAATRELHGMQVVIMYGVCTRCKELP